MRRKAKKCASVRITELASDKEPTRSSEFISQLTSVVRHRQKSSSVFHRQQRLARFKSSRSAVHVQFESSASPAGSVHHQILWTREAWQIWLCAPAIATSIVVLV